MLSTKKKQSKKYSYSYADKKLSPFYWRYILPFEHCIDYANSFSTYKYYSLCFILVVILNL